MLLLVPETGTAREQMAMTAQKLRFESSDMVEFVGLILVNGGQRQAKHT